MYTKYYIIHNYSTDEYNVERLRGKHKVFKTYFESNNYTIIRYLFPD